MQKEYPITYEGLQVGTAQVRSCGLYYEIQCRCRFKKKQLYRLYCITAHSTVYMGIPVPEGSHFTLRKRIPAKNIRMDACTVYASTNENFVPIDTANPFSCMESIERGKLVVRDPVVGILFTDQSQGLQDNDPNP